MRKKQLFLHHSCCVRVFVFVQLQRKGEKLVTIPDRHIIEVPDHDI